MSDGLEDSIRDTHRSHRKSPIDGQIRARIDEEREFRLQATQALALPSGGSKGPLRPKKGMLEDSLPLSPSKAAKHGLTSVLPPMQVRNNQKFQKFLSELTTNPDIRHQYPTYTALAEHFEVTVQTIKTWLLSEEVGRALRAGMSQEALMCMPSVVRSVRLRAELTGDPHAAEWLRKVAKMGTAESDATRSFERTLREIAAERAKAAQAPPVKVIDVTPT